MRLRTCGEHVEESEISQASSDGSRGILVVVEIKAIKTRGVSQTGHRVTFVPLNVFKMNGHRIREKRANATRENVDYASSAEIELIPQRTRFLRIYARFSRGE